MLRLFDTLCKSVLEKLSDKAVFQEATDSYRYHSEQCPTCGTKGKLAPYGDYSRNLVSHDGEEVLESRVSTLRFECVSCGTTHALLPDIVVPYSPYSLRFMLTVLLAYFERDTTVLAVCASYNIAISTLYAWKDRLIKHKDLLLGMLASHEEPALEFLRGLLASTDLSDRLRGFFRRHAFSFLQNRLATPTRSGSP
jgi:transposase-like protein